MPRKKFSYLCQKDKKLTLCVRISLNFGWCRRWASESASNAVKINYKEPEELQVASHFRDFLQSVLVRRCTSFMQEHIALSNCRVPLLALVAKALYSYKAQRPRQGKTSLFDGCLRRLLLTLHKFLEQEGTCTHCRSGMALYSIMVRQGNPKIDTKWRTIRHQSFQCVHTLCK